MEEIKFQRTEKWASKTLQILNLIHFILYIIKEKFCSFSAFLSELIEVADNKFDASEGFSEKTALKVIQCLLYVLFYSSLSADRINTDTECYTSYRKNIK